jgi:hypothetical protein
MRFNWAAYRKGGRSMQRKSTAALCFLAVAILLACTRNGPPNSLFESAGYHVRDGKAYYLNAFPGKAFEIGGADAATFQRSTPPMRATSNGSTSMAVLRGAYARDDQHVFYFDLQIADADLSSFGVSTAPTQATPGTSTGWARRLTARSQYLPRA